ncbi:MAG: tetratricopeptide repeat protein [Thermoactinospora sp.]|nr:tetratricopeptide repeat protein [Thermoactinospora sp.]
MYSPQAANHNLPVEPNRFIGRARDVEELCALFADERVVTLCGVGGIGKTRLALRVAERLVHRFPGGVRLVELARLARADLVAKELAGVLGVREEGARPLVDGLIENLRGARTLLVLDNCEHLVEACAELVARLVASCPDLRVLVTSREPLRIPQELIWRVPPLDLPDARRPDAESVLLFMERATAAGIRISLDVLPDVADLCVALDGLPLALELSAARTKVLSPRQIIDRIGDRFTLLTSGDRTAPARHRTLLATVQWSHDLLEEKEKTLLHRLSVFPGDFDLAFAEQVCHDDHLRQEEILDLLSGLVDKSLVIGEGERFRLLATIRQFAAERLAEAGEDDRFAGRHLREVLAVQARGLRVTFEEQRMERPDRLEAFQRASALLDDSRAALDWAIRAGDARAGIELCLIAAAPLAVAGDVAEAADWLVLLLAMDVSAVAASDLLMARSFIAYGLEARDELLQARELALEGVEGLRSGAYHFRLGVVYAIAVRVLLRLGEREAAGVWLEELIDRARAHADRFTLAAALLYRSTLAMAEGRLREARRHVEEALRAAREHGHPWIIAQVSLQLGVLAEARGDLEAALGHLAAAVPLNEELDNRAELARVLSRSGRVAGQLGDFAAARRHLARSLALAKGTGQRLTIAHCLSALSVLAEKEGDLEGAVLTAAAVHRLRESMAQPASRARTDELMSRARAKLGDGRAAALWAKGGELSPEEAAGRVLEQEHVCVVDPPPVRQRTVLTAREQEIAGLLMRGLSNRAIGEELVISPATVARHIANIMDKLGFTSRAQIAVWAAEHDLGSA